MSGWGTGGDKKSFLDVVKANLPKDSTPSPAVSSSAPVTVPSPSVVPKPAIKPPPVTTAKSSASCAPKTPKERGFPLGFKDKAQFDECMGELATALSDEGIDATAVGVRGSSVTFKSMNPRKKGSFFDKRGKGASDIDVFFVTDDRLKPRPTKSGMFHDSDMAANYPKIDEWNKKWSDKLDPKRKVAAAGFKPGASMKPTSAESIVHSGAL